MTRTSIGPVSEYETKVGTELTEVAKIIKVKRISNHLRNLWIMDLRLFRPHLIGLNGLDEIIRRQHAAVENY